MSPLHEDNLRSRCTREESTGKEGGREIEREGDIDGKGEEREITRRRDHLHGAWQGQGKRRGGRGGGRG
jgi:hypothetical protein